MSDTFAPPVAPDRLLTERDILELLRVGRTTLREMWSHDRFPRPYRVSVRWLRWRESEVQEWLESCPRC